MQLVEAAHRSGFLGWATAFFQFVWSFWHCARWLLLPPQRQRPVAGDPGKGKATWQQWFQSIAIGKTLHLGWSGGDVPRGTVGVPPGGMPMALTVVARKVPSLTAPSTRIVSPTWISVRVMGTRRLRKAVFSSATKVWAALSLMPRRVTLTPSRSFRSWLAPHATVWRARGRSAGRPPRPRTWRPHPPRRWR